MDKLTPRAVIFDLGSTLIEYPSSIWDELSDQCVSAARAHLAGLGVELPDDETFRDAYHLLRDELRMTAAETLVEWSVDQLTQKLLSQFGVEPTAELVEAFFDAYYERVRPHVHAFDDTREVLAAVQSRYGTVGLVSNTIFPERAHLDELDRFGLAPYFSFMVFSSTFGLRKPHADIFYHAANLAGYAPAECVYVGDRHYEDVEGPSGVGMPAVLKWHPQREYPDFGAERPRQVTSLSELSDHFDF